MISLVIDLDFPSSKLAGHTKGNWRGNSGIVASTRQAAKERTEDALAEIAHSIPDGCDIALTTEFYPPNNRGDRVNYPNRMKSVYDGIAEAMGVNDKRFLPVRNRFFKARKDAFVRVIIEPYELGEAA
jgi:hypothetical protein